jgi:hypothetical protein
VTELLKRRSWLLSLCMRRGRPLPVMEVSEELVDAQLIKFIIMEAPVCRAGTAGMLRGVELLSVPFCLCRNRGRFRNPGR